MAGVQRPWPANPRAVLAAMYARRSAGGGAGVTFGGTGNMIPDIPFDQIGTPAHTGIYREENGNTWTNEDARIPDGWELFGPTLGMQGFGGGNPHVVQCIIKIADRDRILYVPPRERVPQQWVAVNIDNDRLLDLLDQGWQIYETPYVCNAGGMIFVTLVKSPPAIPPVPVPVPVPPIPPAPAAVNVNIPPNVPPAPPQGGTRRRKRTRKLHRKTISK
jgi:hypothetical protein